MYWALGVVLGCIIYFMMFGNFEIEILGKKIVWVGYFADKKFTVEPVDIKPKPRPRKRTVIRKTKTEKNNGSDV